MGVKKPKDVCGHKIEEYFYCKTPSEAIEYVNVIAEKYNGARWASGEPVTKSIPSSPIPNTYPLWMMVYYIANEGIYSGYYVCYQSVEDVV